MKVSNWLIVALCVLWIQATSFGCVRIEHTIILNADGSGKLIEKIWIADWVVQAGKGNPGLTPISDLLKEKNVRDRIAAYGAVTFVSHDIIDRGSHGMESSTVMSFANINALTLPAVLSSGKISFALGDKKKRNETTFSGWDYGVSQSLRISQTARPAASATTLSPAQKQQWENLLPVLRAMAEGFSITAKIQAFGPIAGKPEHTLYEVSDKDLDGDMLIDLLGNGRIPGASLGKDSYSVDITEVSKADDAGGN